MARDQRLDRRARGGIQPVERLIKQPDRSAARHGAGEDRALALTGREVAHRHIEQIAQAQRGDRPVGGLAAIEPRPEIQRLAQRKPAIERQPLIGQRHFALMRDAARERSQQPRQDADQARFADPVGPGQMQRRARIERERHPPEQHPVAAPAGKVGGGEAARLHRGRR